jgi:cell division topological specificity factor
VIAKHVPVERDKVRVKVERDGEMSILEIEVEMPASVEPRIAMRA